LQEAGRAAAADPGENFGARMNRLFAELKRCNVLRAGAFYAASA
jgi:hypothetical protein